MLIFQGLLNKRLKSDTFVNAVNILTDFKTEILVTKSMAIFSHVSLI